MTFFNTGISDPTDIHGVIGEETHNSASCGRWEESVLVADEEEVRLGPVKGVGEVIGLRAHYVLRQAEGMREPLQRGVLTMGDVALLEGNLDL